LIDNCLTGPKRSYPGRDSQFSQFLWNGKIALAVSINGTILSSENGTDWTVRLDSDSAGFNSVTWTGNGFLAVGLRTFSSTDGIKWIPKGFTHERLGHVIWTGKAFLAVSQENRGIIWKSSDGSEWDSLSLGDLPWMSSILISGNQIIAAGMAGFLMTSPDGEKWTRRETGATENINAMVWTGTHYFAIGNWGTLLESKDGISWQSDFSGTSQTLNSIAYTGSQYIAVGDQSTLAFSSNGVFWKSMRVFTDLPRVQNRLNAVAFGNGQTLIEEKAGIFWPHRMASIGKPFMNRRAKYMTSFGQGNYGWCYPDMD